MHGDKFPAHYDPTQPPCWEWPNHFGYTQEQEKQVWKQVWSDSSFWQSLDEEPYGSEAVNKLDKLAFSGHDIYFITNRSGVRAKLQTERWLEARGMYNPTVLVTGDKIPVVRALKLDAYIDDKPETLIELGKDVILRTYAKLTSYNAKLRPWSVFPVQHVYQMIDEECKHRGIS